MIEPAKGCIKWPEKENIEALTNTHSSEAESFPGQVLGDDIVIAITQIVCYVSAGLVRSVLP